MSRTRTALLLLMGVASSLCFNLDTDKPTIFPMHSAGFGHSVVQYANWVVVGAPLEIKAVNQTGGLYRCDYSTATCEPIQLQTPPEAVNMSLGLSLTAATTPPRLLACGPTVHHACNENMHLAGVCFLWASSSWPTRRLPDALQECPRQEQDIVFLIDGSGSISSRDFAKMLSFVKAVMSQFQRPRAQFSLMQFSSTFRVHFTFKEFSQSSNPLRLLDSVRQLNQYTHTASAILRVTEELFSAHKGARQDASKILIVITDGDKTGDNLEYEDVIPRAEAKGIVRYAVGVGSAFQDLRAFAELNAIASRPPQEHIFRVDNFDALRDIQRQLKEKIFAIEGTHTVSSSSFELEMSQEGFSAVLTPDGPVLGAVGSYSWSGGAFLYPQNKKPPTFINMSQENLDMMDSYLGERRLWLARWQCRAILRGEQGHPWGRFGAALTAMGDVNGDKLTDVAIGAPGEDENQGAVYLFHGASGPGLSPSHSQRIRGSQLSPGLQHFGQSLSGGQDLTLDGLVDLAVGAQGHALLLRTRPVLRVWVDIRITPAEIARSVFECRENTASIRDLGDATVCLRVHESPRTRLGNLQSDVTFDLTLDPGHLSPRAIFKETNTRHLSRVRVLGLRQHCEDVKLLLPACVEDAMIPITLSLNFSLVGQPIPSFGNLQPILAPDTRRHFTTSLPFEKNCGDDHVCQDDLGITVDASGLETLVVGNTLELNMGVKVWNEGEDSYGTTVTFSYPPGLSYRRATVTQSRPPSRSLQLACDSGSQDAWSTRCSLKHIIFREGAQVTFVATFDVSPKAILGDRLLLMANVSSENNSPRTSRTTSRLELPVKYSVYIVVSSHEESTKYLNFSAPEEEGSSVAQLRYQVSNPGQRDLPVSIYFLVPVELNQAAVWTELELLHPQSPSMNCSSERIAPTEADPRAHIQKNPALDCSAAACQRFRCDVPSFGTQEELDFTLKGNLSFGWVRQTLQKKVSVVSVAGITFDRSVYAQLPGQEASLRAQMEMVLEEYEVYDPVPLIVGSCVGGLLLLALITAMLFKLGFFKRRYKEMMDDKPEDAAMFSGEAPNLPLS
ncbi:PREDICTED: integrin alpha-X [Myotis davidii]|uniref:integrin alpha-X n=1 Tax=Myotis davidii TaxID=225400 RepID=UPI000766E431|nr:PREDICTED: integrin alpha-X [Myotis davidii]